MSSVLFVTTMPTLPNMNLSNPVHLTFQSFSVRWLRTSFGHSPKWLSDGTMFTSRHTLSLSNAGIAETSPLRVELLQRVPVIAHVLHTSCCWHSGSRTTKLKLIGPVIAARTVRAVQIGYRVPLVPAAAAAPTKTMNLCRPASSMQPSMNCWRRPELYPVSSPYPYRS
jgi:hypothetical protein